jgi:hypothetical protein
MEQTGAIRITARDVGVRRPSACWLNHREAARALPRSAQMGAENRFEVGRAAFGFLPDSPLPIESLGGMRDWVVGTLGSVHALDNVTIIGSEPGCSSQSATAGQLRLWALRPFSLCCPPWGEKPECPLR